MPKLTIQKVPIIAGRNTHEGTSFGPTGISTTNQWYNYLTNIYSKLSSVQVFVLLKSIISEPQSLGSDIMPRKDTTVRIRVSLYSSLYTSDILRRGLSYPTYYRFP